MKSKYKELIIVLVCFVVGFFISRLILHYFPGPPSGNQTAASDMKR